MVAMWSAQLSVIYHLGFGRHSTCVGRPFLSDNSYVVR